MTNTFLNIIYQINTSGNITVKNNPKSSIEMLLKTENSYAYKYDNQNKDPYGLKNYFNGINRDEEIKIYTSGINKQPLLGTSSEVFQQNNYKITKNLQIKGLNNKSVPNDYQVFMKYPNYIPPSGLPNDKISNKIALLLGKIKKNENGGYDKVNIGDNNTIQYGNNNFFRYVPTIDEMKALNTMLLVEIKSQGTRSDVMWQREKATILWCFVNMIAGKKQIDNNIIRLMPVTDSYFPAYLSGSDFYKNMLDQSIPDNLKALYNESSTFDKKYNFELFIDAFFKGYFPEEIDLSGYTNWSHLTPLNQLSGFHLPNDFNGLKQGKSISDVYSLDGNIILSKTMRIPSERKE